MASFYIKYVPMRRGLYGSEFLTEFVRDKFPNLTWAEYITDGTTSHFGKLTGSGDELSRCLTDADGRFSILRLTESEMVGFCHMYHPDNQDSTAFTDWMTSATGIVVDEEDILEGARNAKRALFKEIVKKRFAEDNDNISDLARAVTLLDVYNDGTTLSGAQVTRMDAAIVKIKSLYSAEMCVQAIETIADQMEEILTPYYVAVGDLNDSTSTTDAYAVEMS